MYLVGLGREPWATLLFVSVSSQSVPSPFFFLTSALVSNLTREPIELKQDRGNQPVVFK